jgi:hypothetical protein
MLDDLAAPPSLQIGDEADAAGVVLARRIVESLRREPEGPRSIATPKSLHTSHGNSNFAASGSRGVLPLIKT